MTDFVLTCCFDAPFCLGGFKGSTGDFSLEKKTPSETLRWQAGAPAGLGEPRGQTTGKRGFQRWTKEKGARRMDFCVSEMMDR